MRCSDCIYYDLDQSEYPCNDCDELVRTDHFKGIDE